MIPPDPSVGREQGPADGNRWINPREIVPSPALNPPVNTLMPSLARVVRGLSAVFWGMPLLALAAARAVLGEGPRLIPGGWAAVFGPWGRVIGDTLAATLFSLAAGGLVWYGLRQLLRFQPQEQIWIDAVHRALLGTTAVMGLLPFAYWWSRFPYVALFDRGVALLFAAGIVLGLALNHLLVRLAAMLPDPILRGDARMLSRINQALLLGLLAFAAVDWWMPRWLPWLPATWLPGILLIHELRSTVMLLGVLVPLALTMTLLWKAKETIVAGVFRGG